MPPTTPLRSGRQRALAAALAVLRRDGLEAMSMRAVAEEAGVTATALYRHFADKDALIAELVREAGALFRDYLGPALERTDPADRLLGILVAARSYALDEPRLYQLLFLTPLGRPRRYPEGFRTPGGDFGAAAEIVGEAMAAGVLREDDPVDVTRTLTSHLHGLLRLWLLDRFADRETFEAFTDASFTRILAGLAPDR